MVIRFVDMDTILYFTTLTLLLGCHKVQAEDEKILQSEPQDDSYRIVKYLQLYQQQQQRLANSKAMYANDRFYPRNDQPVQHRGKDGDITDSLSGDTEESDYENSRNRGGWKNRAAGDFQRHQQGQPRVRLPPKTTSEVVGPETPSGYISVKVYPPAKEQSKDEVEHPDGEIESATFKKELLQENKKSLQTPFNSDANFGSYSARIATNIGPVALPHSSEDTERAQKNPFSDLYFIVIVAGCSAAAIFGVIAAGYCFYKFQKNSKAAAEVDYPAYGVTGPSKEHTSPSGDRKLAQSAQMYHYQHQKQQMIAVENATTNRQTSNSDVDSEEENEEGDYTVYECPGLAPTGEMEVKNPLFHDDSTPMSPPVVYKDVKKP